MRSRLLSTNLDAEGLTIDEALDRLHRAGRTVGVAAFGEVWQVDGANGENQLLARATTLEGAYRLACEQAQAVGMLAPPRIMGCEGR